MANSKMGPRAPESVKLSYQLIRNTTSPDEKSCGVQSFVANIPAFEVLKLNTKDNLRSYLAEYNPRKRNRVHDAIQNTINTEPQRFITRNGGLVITVSDIQVDDGKRTVTLHDASIINGSQTQGEIRRYLQELDGFDDPNPSESPFLVRAEIIVDDDVSQVVETAIARNTATPVKSISQAGARGHLDELEKSIQQYRPDAKIRKSETDEDVLDTRKILQWCRLLMPVAISKNSAPAERLRPYKNPEQCLTDFSDWYENRTKDPDKAAKYDFTVQIAPHALEEYQNWEAHKAWNGHQIWEQTKKGRACRRQKRNGKLIVTWISPGIIYPIMGAMSEFVREENGQWEICKPSRFRPDEMVARAVAQFRAHNSDPMAMGRSEGAYDALRIYPNTLVEVLKDVGGDPDD